MTTNGVVVVTGGGRGIGRAIAFMAAECGHSVCINYLERSQPAEQVVEQIRSLGGTATAIRADVSQDAEAERLFEQADRLGTLVGLVNNAGITGEATRVQNLSTENLRRVFEVNVYAAFICAKLAVQRMSKRVGGAGGAIVNISSGASRYGSAGSHVHYAASKAAIETLTIGLAREVAAEGVRVNAIRAGVVATEIHSSKRPERMEALLGSIPMQRMGEPHEVANAAIWLLSDAASYTTGAIIDVTGGL